MATIMHAAPSGGGVRRTPLGVLALIASAFLVAPAWAQTLGFVDDFSTPGTNGWSSINANTNPGTGGVGGAGDGYLNIAQFPNPFNFGSHNDGPNYAGNWTAAGITGVSFYLNDVNTDEVFSFHFLITGDEGAPTGQSTFVYNVGFDPPSGAWQQYFVDFANPDNWTRIEGDASLSDVLADVADAHFRHDVEPFLNPPDRITGDIGIDNIALVPAPGAASLMLAGIGLAMIRRRARR
jgi:hypothetical protein